MRHALILLTFLLFTKQILAQNKQSIDLNLECIAFYNLENLFDTIVDPDTNKILQDDFTPFGAKKFLKGGIITNYNGLYQLTPGNSTKSTLHY